MSYSKQPIVVAATELPIRHLSLIQYLRVTLELLRC